MSDILFNKIYQEVSVSGTLNCNLSKRIMIWTISGIFCFVEINWYQVPVMCILNDVLYSSPPAIQNVIANPFQMSFVTHFSHNLLLF